MIVAKLSAVPREMRKIKFFTWCKLAYERWFQEGFLYRKAQDDFYRCLGGHILFEALYAGVELDLFNLLATHREMTLEEIAEKLHLEPQPCRILLLSLTVAGMIRFKRGKYSNTRAAQRFLVKDAAWKYADCVRWQHHINYRALYWFVDALKSNKNVGLKEFEGTEPTLYQRLARKPQLEMIFQSAMQEISQQSNDLLGTALPLEGVKRLVDVGGGNGTNIICLAKHHPQLKAAIFDFPSVCEIAHKNFEQQGFSEQLSAIPGNIFEDPIPSGFDCVLFCHFLTIWSAKENLTLLKKAYDALPSGGKVVIFNMMQNNDRSGPITAAIGSPYFLTLATGRGMLYTWNEYESWLREAGFSRISCSTLTRDHGVYVGVKA